MKNYKILKIKLMEFTNCETMQGYLNYALDFAKESDVEFTDEQINIIKSGFNWGKDEMTMENARVYRRIF